MEPIHRPAAILVKAVEEQAVDPDLDRPGPQAADAGTDDEKPPAGRQALHAQPSPHGEHRGRQDEAPAEALHEVPAGKRPAHEHERGDKVEDSHAGIGLAEVALDRGDERRDEERAPAEQDEARVPQGRHAARATPGRVHGGHAAADRRARRASRQASRATGHQASTLPALPYQVARRLGP